MNAQTKINLLGAIATVTLLGMISLAQEDKIQDQDLLNLLNTVNEEAAVPTEVSKPADTPVSQTLETLEVASERADEADVVTAETDSVESEEILDNLQIAVVDPSAGSSSDNLISVRLTRVGLEEAINLFAQLSGANIIVPELTEAAQISVNLKDVEWRPALQSILDTYDYELYQKVSGSNVFSVRRRPPGAPEPQVVETFVLKYATVPNAALLVRDLLPADAKISEFASRNMLVVKSSESSLSEVRAVLETIDIVRQQVFIESKFMELSDDAQKDLGINWGALQAYSAGTAGATTETSTKTDSSDKITTTFTDATGAKYADASGFTTSGSLDPNTPIYEGLTPFITDTTTKTTTKVLTSVLSADEFRLVMSALEQNKGVNVVSNPKVIVANEELANISIIRKEPNLKQERQQTAGAQGGAAIDNIVFSLDEELPFFDYGIKLEVLPSINTSSNITVQINPSLTRKFADKPAGEVTYPIIDEKSIKTVFNLASGQTAAIGGLTEVTEGEEESKVPVLGSLPFLGRLFSWKRTIHGQSETIIFVTVGLANTENLTSETGMPEDAELARRQVIKDANNRKLRDSGRIYFAAEQDDKLEDMMKVMKAREDERVESRIRAWKKEQEKAAREEAKNEDVALND